MLELLEQILQRADAGESLAVCTLVAARGSTPQKPPAMMVVLASGQTLGTIGGGCVEAEVKTRAIRSLADTNGSAANVAKVSEFKLNHDFGWDDGLVCGGTMEVAVQVIRSSADAASLRTVHDAMQAGRTGQLSIAAIAEDGAERVYQHALEPRPVLLIAGAGHVGSALAVVARQIDFYAVVVDERSDLNNPVRLAGAKCVVEPIDAALAKFPITPNTYVVIVTRGHKHDASALAAVIGSPAKYIGLIGSKRKIVTIYEDLLQQGVPADRLRAVHAPIGLDIGAVTPGEIAVSIGAELIAVRRESRATQAGSMRLPTSIFERLAPAGSAQSELTNPESEIASSSPLATVLQSQKPCCKD